MSRPACRLAPLVLGLLLAGCRSGPTEEALRQGLATMKANCLVVVLDAAGAGHFQAHLEPVQPPRCRDHESTASKRLILSREKLSRLREVDGIQLVNNCKQVHRPRPL
jgi:hypothetical protein